MTVPVQHYLACRYEDGARGLNAFDCWGMVRDVLAEHFGVPAEHVPAFGHISPDDKRGMTQARDRIVDLYELADPRPGAVACHTRKRVLVHVGIVVEVDGALRVLHTSRQWGPSLDTLRRFEQLGTHTEYFRYVG